MAQHLFDAAGPGAGLGSHRPATRHRWTATALGIELNVGIRGNATGNDQRPNDYFGDVRPDAACSYLPT